MEAYAWFRSEGGGFGAWAGPDPPALMLAGVMFYAQELGACRAIEWEKRRPHAD